MFIGSTLGKKIDGFKTNTNAHGVKIIEAPDFIYIPVKEFAGTSSKILVKRGDHVKKGQLVALLDDVLYIPTFSSVSGKVTSFEDRLVPGKGIVQHIVIENNHKDTSTKEIKQVSLAADHKAITEAIKAAGILGMGGAGFPTYKKVEAAREAKAHTLLINAIECEPFLTSDKFNATDQNNAVKLFEGALLTMKAIGAETVVIAIKKKNSDLVKALEAALSN
jgi:electron transport complex protein RnfC